MTTYTVTTKRVIARSGVLGGRDTIFLTRISDIQIEKDVDDRIFGCGNARLTDVRNDPLLLHRRAEGGDGSGRDFQPAISRRPGRHRRGTLAATAPPPAAPGSFPGLVPIEAALWGSRVSVGEVGDEQVEITPVDDSTCKTVYSVSAVESTGIAFSREACDLGECSKEQDARPSTRDNRRTVVNHVSIQTPFTQQTKVTHVLKRA